MSEKSKPLFSFAHENKDELARALGFKSCYEGFHRLFKDDFSKEALEIITNLRAKFDTEDKAKQHEKMVKSKRGKKGKK